MHSKIKHVAKPAVKFQQADIFGILIKWTIWIDELLVGTGTAKSGNTSNLLVYVQSSEFWNNSIPNELKNKTNQPYFMNFITLIHALCNFGERGQPVWNPDYQLDILRLVNRYVIERKFASIKNTFNQSLKCSKNNLQYRDSFEIMGTKLFSISPIRSFTKNNSRYVELLGESLISFKDITYQVVSQSRMSCCNQSKWVKYQNRKFPFEILTQYVKNYTTPD